MSSVYVVCYETFNEGYIIDSGLVKTFSSEDLEAAKKELKSLQEMKVEGCKCEDCMHAFEDKVYSLRECEYYGPNSRGNKG